MLLFVLLFLGQAHADVPLTCLNNMDTCTLCQFDSSCCHTNYLPYLSDATGLANLQNDGATKIIGCSPGLQFKLKYRFVANATTSPQCSYSIDTDVDTDLNTQPLLQYRLHLVLDRVNASTIWNATDCTLNPSDCTGLHGSVSDSTQLCQTLKSLGQNTIPSTYNNNSFACRLPFTDDQMTSGSIFCSLLSSVDFQCNAYPMVCTLEPGPGLTYECSNTTAVSYLSVDCTHVDFVLVGDMLRESADLLQLAPVPFDLDQLPQNQLHNSTTRPGCTRMAQSCSSFFCQAPPFLGPYDSSFCQFPPNATVLAHGNGGLVCNGQPIDCFSQTGRFGIHQCLYNLFSISTRGLPPVFADCFISGTADAVQAVYNASDRLDQARLSGNSLDVPVASRALSDSFVGMCNFLLSACSATALYCPTTTQSIVTMQPVPAYTRDSYCTLSVHTSCLGIADQFPLPSVLSSNNSDHIQCRLSSTVNHTIACTLQVQDLNAGCYYSCTVSDSILFMTGYPVFGNVLIAGNLSTAVRCATMRSVALTPTTTTPNPANGLSNSFICTTPGKTVLGTNGSVIDICFATNDDISNLCTGEQQAEEAPQLRVFLCGLNPIYRVECIQQRNFTALHDWYRCTTSFLRNTTANFPPDALPSTDVSDSLAARLLSMDCEVRKNIIIDAHTKDWNSFGFIPQSTVLFDEDIRYIMNLGLFNLINGSTPVDMTTAQLMTFVNVTRLMAGFQSVCSTILQQCVLPTTCTQGVDCWCPTNDQMDSQHYVCRLPGRTCQNTMCQLDTDVLISAITVNATSPSSQVCLFSSPTLSFQCSGGDVRAPRVYTIVCTRLDQTIISEVLYECRHDFNSTRGSGDAYFIGNLTQISQLRFLQSEPSYPGVYLRVTVSEAILTAGDNDQVCQLIGLNALQQRMIQCESPYIETIRDPFCVSQADLSASISLLSFTCSSLVITCERVTTASISGSQNTQVFCYSMPSSTIWTLQDNIDPITFPTPPFRTGCLLGPPQAPGNFYSNPASRCSTIATFCKHTCRNSQFQLATAGTESFCDIFQLRIQSFQCSGQWIVCLPNDQNSTAFLRGDVLASTPISRVIDQDDLSSRFLIDADGDHHSRTMNCFQQTSVLPVAVRYNVSNVIQSLTLNPPSGVDTSLVGRSLILDCQVNEFVFSTNTDVCVTLRAQCAQNRGTIQCVSPYVATLTSPFCSIRAEAIANETRCDCGVWWSDSEGFDLYPAVLEDVQCTHDDPLNVLFGNEVSDSVCTNHRKSQWSGITCERRGYLSFDLYLRMKYGGSYPAQSFQIYSTEPWKRHWCLDSFVHPAATCAVRPASRLPLCTIECPVGLNQTTLGNSIARYCCLDVDNCQNADDQRNCVMGRDDPTYAETPPLNGSSVFISRGNPDVVTQSLAPTNPCPSNLFNFFSVFPFRPNLDGLMHDLNVPLTVSLWSQVRQMCYQDQFCKGYVSIVDANSGDTGVYFMHRNPQFPLTRLSKLYTWRKVMYDTENSYHLHRSADSLEDRQSSVLVDGTIDELSYGTSRNYVLERTHGFQCSDDRLDWVNYMDLSQRATTVGRVQRRVNQQLIELGAPPQLVSLFNWATEQSGGRTNILNSNIHNENCGPEFASSVLGRCPFRRFLVIDLQKELERDLALGLDWAGMALNITAASSSLLESHRQFHFLRSSVPLFGDQDGVFRRSVHVYNDGRLPFGILEPDLPTDRENDVWLAGWMELPMNAASFTVATFWDLFAYYAWRDYYVYGALVPQDFNRLPPNDNCQLNTPLYWSTLTKGCSVHRCAPAVSPLWNWRAPSGETRSWDLGVPFPNPPETEVQYDLNEIPCSGNGVCHSTSQIVGVISDSLAGAIAMTGQCSCFGFFNVEIGIDVVVFDETLGLNVIPRSKIVRGCEWDGRGYCNAVEIGETLLCNNQGRCVIQFSGGKQYPVCACGRYPPGLVPITEAGGTCTLDFNQLITSEGPVLAPDCFLTSETPDLFIPTGYELGGMCGSPNLGCRNPGAYHRVERDRYVRGQSWGCTTPRLPLKSNYRTGDCVGNPPPPVPHDVDISWSCDCHQGWYGDLCQYPTINQGCYDRDEELFLVIQSTIRSAVTTCIWNVYLGTYEPLAHSNMPADVIALLLDPDTALPNAAIECLGLTCSGHGTCSHALMNNLNAEIRLDPIHDPTFNYSTDTISDSDLTFYRAVQTRLLNQQCTCDDGYTGEFCEQRTCFPPCTLPAICIVSPDARSPSNCSCPTDKYGRALVKGGRCEGEICGGRGTLMVDPDSPVNKTIYLCACTPPYFENGNQTISLSTPVCNATCPDGQIRVDTVGPTGKTVSICACIEPRTGRTMPCDRIGNTVFTKFLFQLEGGGILPPPTNDTNSTTNSSSSSSSSSGDVEIQSSSSVSIIESSSSAENLVGITEGGGSFPVAVTVILSIIGLVVVLLLVAYAIRPEFVRPSAQEYTPVPTTTS